MNVFLIMENVGACDPGYIVHSVFETQQVAQLHIENMQRNYKKSLENYDFHHDNYKGESLDLIIEEM